MHRSIHEFLPAFSNPSPSAPQPVPLCRSGLNRIVTRRGTLSYAGAYAGPRSEYPEPREFFFRDLAGVWLLRDMTRLANADPGFLHQVVRRAQCVNCAGEKADEQGA
jgi:hypothetical protein